MSNKTKGIIFLILFGITCATYGAYMFAVLNEIRDVQIHQWLLTAAVGLMFLLNGIKKLEKRNDGYYQTSDADCTKKKYHKG